MTQPQLDPIFQKRYFKIHNNHWQPDWGWFQRYKRPLELGHAYVIAGEPGHHRCLASYPIPTHWLPLAKFRSHLPVVGGNFVAWIELGSLPTWQLSNHETLFSWKLIPTLDGSSIFWHHYVVQPKHREAFDHEWQSLFTTANAQFEMWASFEKAGLLKEY